MQEKYNGDRGGINEAMDVDLGKKETELKEKALRNKVIRTRKASMVSGS